MAIFIRPGILMKQYYFAFAALLVMAGLVNRSDAAAAPGSTPGTAVVKLVQGQASGIIKGAPQPLKVDMVLTAGDTVTTGPNSTVILDLGKNGNALSVKSDSTLKIDTLHFKETGVGETVVETELDLTKGSIIGNVKKLSSNSRYEVKTQNGVAGIRGTSFHIYAIGIFRVASGSIVINVRNLVTREVTRIVIPPGRECSTAPGTTPAGTPPPTVPMSVESRRFIVVETQTQTLVIPTGPPPPGESSGQPDGKKDAKRELSEQELRDRAAAEAAQNAQRRDEQMAKDFAQQAFRNATNAGLSTNLALIISNGVQQVFNDARDRGQTVGQAATGANSLRANLQTNLLNNPGLTNDTNQLNTLRTNAVNAGGTFTPSLGNKDLTRNPVSPINPTGGGT